MSQDSIRLGSLIKYLSTADETICGIVTKHFEYYARGIDGEAVEIFWMDGEGCTIESIKNIRDPDIEYMQVISENR